MVHILAAHRASQISCHLSVWQSQRLGSQQVLRAETSLTRVGRCETDGWSFSHLGSGRRALDRLTQP